MFWILLFLIFRVDGAQVIYYLGDRLNGCPGYPDVRCVSANVTTVTGATYVYDGIVGSNLASVLPSGDSPAFVYRTEITPRTATVNCELCPVYTRSIGIVNVSCTDVFPLLCACRTSVALFSPAPSAAPTTAPTMMYTTSFITRPVRSYVRMTSDGGKWTASRTPIYLYDRVHGQIVTPGPLFQNLTSCMSDVQAVTYCCLSVTRNRFRCSDGYVATAVNGTDILNYMRYRYGSVITPPGAFPAAFLFRNGISVQSRDGVKIFSSLGANVMFPSGLNVTVGSSVRGLNTNWDGSLLAVLIQDELILFSGSGSVIWRTAVTGFSMDADDTLDHIIVSLDQFDLVAVFTRSVLSGIQYSVAPSGSPVLSPTRAGWTNPMKLTQFGSSLFGTMIAFTDDEQWMFAVSGQTSISVYARTSGSWTDLTQRIVVSVTSIASAGNVLYVGSSTSGARGTITAYTLSSGTWVQTGDNWLAQGIATNTVSYPIGGYILAGPVLICTGTPARAGQITCFYNRPSGLFGSEVIMVAYSDPGTIHAASPGMEYIISGQPSTGRIVVYRTTDITSGTGYGIQLPTLFPGIMSMSVSGDGKLFIKTGTVMSTYDVNAYTYSTTTGLPVSSVVAADTRKFAISDAYVRDRISNALYPLFSPDALPYGQPAPAAIAMSSNFVAWSSPSDDEGSGAIWIWYKATPRPTQSPSQSPTTSRPTRSPVQVYVQVMSMPAVETGTLVVSVEGKKIMQGSSKLDITPCNNPSASKQDGVRETRFSISSYNSDGAKFDPGWSYSNVPVSKDTTVNACESGVIQGWAALTGYQDDNSTSFPFAKLYVSDPTESPRSFGGVSSKNVKRGRIYTYAFINGGYDQKAVSPSSYESNGFMTDAEARATPGFGYRVAVASNPSFTMVCSTAKYFGGTLECFRNNVEVTGAINYIDGEALGMNWNGTYIVIGAPNLGTGGQIFTYTYPGFSTQTIIYPNQIVSRFGASLDIAGDILVVGSIGAVFVLSLSGSGVWTHRVNILIPGSGALSVAVSCRGTYVVVGDSANQRMIIWKRGTGWTYDEFQTIRRTAVPGFGVQVDISDGDGRTIAVSGTNQVYVYTDATQFSQIKPSLCTGQ